MFSAKCYQLTIQTSLPQARRHPPSSLRPVRPPLSLTSFLNIYIHTHTPTTPLLWNSNTLQYCVVFLYEVVCVSVTKWRGVCNHRSLCILYSYNFGDNIYHFIIIMSFYINFVNRGCSLHVTTTNTASVIYFPLGSEQNFISVLLLALQ